MQRPKLWPWLLVLCTFGVYVPSLWNGHVYDDADIVRVPSVFGQDNEMVASVQPLDRYYTSRYGEGAGGLGRGYRPTTVLSWALVHAATRRDPAGLPPGALVGPPGPQHFVNVLVHCAAVLLTFHMLAFLLGPGWPALLGAAVFGLHALRSDPVISLVGRGELLAYAFGAGGLLAYVAALRRGGLERAVMVFVAASLLFLAFTSKESAVAWAAFVPLFVLAGRWLGCAGLPTLRGQVGPLVGAVGVPLGVFLWMYASVAAGSTFTPDYDANPLWYESASRWPTAWIVWAYGLYKVLAPFSLACDYGAEVFTLARGFGDPRALGSLVLLLAVLAAGVGFARRCPLGFLAVAAFFGFSFVTSNVPMPVETIFGERLYYTPALALSFVVAWLVERIRADAVRRAGAVILALWLVGCAVVIVQRCFEWRSNETLFAADAVRQPRSLAMLEGSVEGLQFRNPNHYRGTLERALQLRPDNPDTLVRVAEFHNEYRQFEPARGFAIRGLTSQHPDAPATRYRLQFQLGRALEGLGQVAEAEVEFRRAAAGAPADDPRMDLHLGNFFRRTNQLAKAEEVFRRMTREHPMFLHSWENLLRIAQDKGDDAAVVELLTQAQRAAPGAVLWTAHAAIMEQRKGNPAGALRLFKEAVPSLPRNVQFLEYWHRFAVLLAQQGEPEAARPIVVSYLQQPLPPPAQQLFVDLAKRLGM